MHAFSKLVEAYRKYVFAIINNIIRDPQETENIAQEVFIQAYSSLSTYQFKGFKTWIGRISTNKSIDYIRSKRKVQVIPLEYIDEREWLEDKPLEEEIIQREEVEAIKNLCEGIPQKYSNVLKKYYLQSLNCRRIAEEEGISIKTVESRLYRARNLLKVKWKEGGP
ncbi:RNA polymerase sigma factor [Alkaliphilus serpentinus]|uniref:RNA polymerase sigma factor n=1 Tax=Alkaliphilus serpentinus TaxID=1482731 RepID=UPI002431F003|nr:RNA polymerase sigma factor [Alkaliphilus serpentinus]